MNIPQRDAALIRDLAPLAIQDYEYLRYSNDRSVKDAFIRGAIASPELYYHDIDEAHVETALADIEALALVVTVYDDAVVRRAYEDKLREVREKYELLRSAALGDDMGVLDASIRLYGRPRTDHFQYALGQMKRRLECVQAQFGAMEGVDALVEPLLPVVRACTNERYAWQDIRLPEPVVYAKAAPLSAREVREVFEDALKRNAIYDWQVIVDASGERTTFSTSHELRTIFIPHDDDLRHRAYALTRERVDALVAHEVGTHVVRRVRGEQSPLALLGIGLAGYLRGEEGIATYEEQRREGTRHFAGGLGYLCVGLVMGLDGVSRDFRGLYEVLCSYLAISMIEHAHVYGTTFTLAHVIERAKRRAWARCVRTFRGTSGTTPGACFTKDIVYLEGNIAIWDLVTRDPSRADKFSVGKYDPTNTEHVTILRDLGVL